jgi:hypothetical protein
MEAYKIFRYDPDYLLRPIGLIGNFERQMLKPRWWEGPAICCYRAYVQEVLKKVPRGGYLGLAGSSLNQHTNPPHGTGCCGYSARKTLRDARPSLFCYFDPLMAKVWMYGKVTEGIWGLKSSHIQILTVYHHNIDEGNEHCYTNPPDWKRLASHFNIESFPPLSKYTLE